MILLEAFSSIIFLAAFFYGAIKLWKKGKPLYFQIIICAIGCCALFHISVIVMAYCNVNETFFNDSFFGIFGCYMLLLCANRGTLEKIIYEKSKPAASVLAVAAGIMALVLSTGVGLYCYGADKPVFYIFVLVQLPACFVVHYNVKHLLSRSDELGLLKGLRFTDIFTLVFCIVLIFDTACWKKVSIISAAADLAVSLAIMALSVSAVRGAKKWSF